MNLKLLELSNVLECRIIGRLNRFVVEVESSGIRCNAYINNTGRLMEYLVRGRVGYCLPNPSNRKTRFRLFAVRENSSAALIDTQIQMKAFEKAVEGKALPWLRNYVIVKRNARLGLSLIDYLLEHGGRRLYLEVKSAVMRGDKIYAMYPDCPTLRGRKHINSLISHVSRGGLGGIVFIAALPEVKAFKPYAHGDPAIPALLRKAWKTGVMIKALGIYYSPQDSSIYLYNPDIPIRLE